jgi:hypothetical protein
VHVQVDKTRADDFSRGVDNPIRRRALGAHRAYFVAVNQNRTIRDNLVAGSGPTHDCAAVNAKCHSISSKIKCA